MPLALKITFSNNGSIVIGESTPVEGIRTFTNEIETGIYPKSATHSGSGVLFLEEHHSAGLIPSAIELFENYNYFSINDDDSIWYASSSIVKIEKIN